MKVQDKKAGIPVDLSSYKGRLNPAFQHPDFMEKISALDRLLQGTSHHILFSGRNRISVIPFPLGEGKTIDIVVKEYFARGLNKIKPFFLPSKAQKAWRGSFALMERRILTPTPVAYLEKSKFPFIDESCYLTVLAEETEEIRYLFRRLAEEELSLLVGALGRYLARCHETGVLHRDLSDGNILAKKEAQGKYTFFLIDTNRIRVKKKLGILKRIKNLTRLGIPDAFQPLFLEEYSGSGRMKKWAWFWYRFNKRTYTCLISFKRSIYPQRDTRPRNFV